jgi:hypothetical protein
MASIVSAVIAAVAVVAVALIGRGNKQMAQAAGDRLDRTELLIQTLERDKAEGRARERRCDAKVAQLERRIAAMEAERER